MPISTHLGTYWHQLLCKLSNAAPPLASGPSAQRVLRRGPRWPWFPVLLGLQLLPGGALGRSLAQGSSTRSLPA
jgi:hypothetical protein